MAQLAVHTENLSRDFATVRAVNNLSLEVPQGSIFGFLGRNGAGKTTTIRLLLGLLEPTAAVRPQHGRVAGYAAAVGLGAAVPGHERGR